jgi:hypothetical protein
VEDELHALERIMKLGAHESVRVRDQTYEMGHRIGSLPLVEISILLEVEVSRLAARYAME